MKVIKNFFISIKYHLFAFLLFYLLWFIFSLFFKEYILPSPFKVLKNINGFLKPEFFENFYLTMVRLITGFIMAYVLGTITGILTFRFKIKTTINTLLILFEVIPGIILGIIFLLIFGIGNSVPVFMTAFLTIPLIAINTSNALYKVNRQMEEFVISYSSSLSNRIKYIYLPALIPAFLSSLSLGFSLALKIVVLGEFIGSQNGIGYLLNVAKIYFNMNEVFFYLAVMVNVMFVFQIIIDMVKELLLRKYFFPE